MLGEGEERKLKEANKGWNFPVSFLWAESLTGLGSLGNEDVHSDSHRWRQCSLILFDIPCTRMEWGMKPIQKGYGGGVR